MIVSVQPKLTGVAAERYLAMARTLARAPLTTEQDRDALLSAELRWAASHPTVGEDRYAFMAAVRVLLDLERLGWKIREDGYGIELYSIPSRRHGLNPEEILEEKKKTKEVFRPAVEAQLRDPAVRAFIQRMEVPTPKTGKKSITGLIAEGSELHARLLAAQACQGEDRDSSLDAAIRPYLQLVTSEGIDEHTGHFLREIWRYFRHTWAIPQFSTPGRQLLYLVRDAAHPSHAVMGIIGLTNTALQMGVEREKDLCWNLEALSERFGKSAREGRLVAEYEWMETQLAATIEDVHAEGLASPEEITHPKPALISLLRRKAKEFDLLRDETLKELARLRSGNDGPLLLVEDGEALELGSDHPPVDDEVLNLEAKPFKSPTMQKARRHLVARKRAALLADLLHARLTLRTHRDDLHNPERFLAVLAREDVRLALQTVLDAIKSRYAGVNMLEISTCGAIPPYNHILGGKLAALLLYSPQIGDDYRRQYSGASIISSQIKNAEVYRDNPLVYLGTTSLYAQGSSQYERVRLPAGTISEQQPELRFRRLGLTAGFGTLQFLGETRNAVEEFLRHQKKFKDVNSIFGEGPSPKLRLLVAGLRELGFPPDALMRHNRQRLIYVTALAPQAVDFLNNRPVELPDYLARPQDFRQAGERVVNYWVTRWLAPRLRHVPSMTALITSGSWKLSDRLPTLEDQETAAAMPLSPPPPDSSAHPGTSGVSVFFWRQLAEAGPKITSDSLSEPEFDRLHVHLAVEDFIAEQVRQGVSLFLTGNAGDGKTHVLRRLAPELRQQGAVVIEDATATMRKGSIAPVLDRWREAVSAKKPFCIAINEYPLHLLRSAARENLSTLAEELDRQCRNRLVYGESSDAEKARNGLLVIDLSLRNPLSQGISGQMLNRILSDPALEQIPAESAPLLRRHLEKLRDERVRKRVLNVFDRLVEVGVRTTMRELWIILARMVLGYRWDVAHPLGEGLKYGYSEVLFSSDPRFMVTEKLHETDPSGHSHPVWDALLEDRSPSISKGWWFGEPNFVVNARPDREEFRALKRAFYCEHERGMDCFALEDPDAAEFRNLLRQGIHDDPQAKRRLIQAINFAFCPKEFPGCEDNLYLWNGHRFHEQPSRSFLANRSIPMTALRLLRPRIPERVKAGLPEYQPDHLLMQHAAANGAIARLRVNFPLFKVLQNLRRGLPRRLLPERESFRLESFMESLDASDVTEERRVLSAHLERREVLEILLSPDKKKYERITKHA